MSFNDDEPIPSLPDAPEKASVTTSTGKTKVEVIKNEEAPLEEKPFTVMVKLTGSNSIDRPGVDLVTVLDVSGSMQKEKLDKVKIAMQFMIRKLSPIDRLSVVSFSNTATRHCPLRRVTETSQPELISVVNDLESKGNTNIADGLTTALRILDDRQLKDGRVAAIILMSDGAQNVGDAATVNPKNVPVHTFGFGADHEPRILTAIAKKNKEGTFSDVQNEKNLSKAFSQCLAGLLTVVVQNLEITLLPVRTKLQTVLAGNYPQTVNKKNGSVTISFGNLYIKETRRITVELLLPAIANRAVTSILEIRHQYDMGVGTTTISGKPLTVKQIRDGRSVDQPEKEEVVVEECRVKTADMMKEARELADQEKLEDAKEKLEKATDNVVKTENLIENANNYPNPLLKTLKRELQMFLKLMDTQEIYEKKGRSFGLALETSHETQRCTAKGDDMDKFRCFATERMDTLVKQAATFDEDPTKPVPTEKDDVDEELAKDPLGPLFGALSYEIQAAIQALQNVDDILNSYRPRV